LSVNNPDALQLATCEYAIMIVSFAGVFLVKRRVDAFAVAARLSADSSPEIYLLALLKDTTPAERALRYGSSRKFFLTVAEMATGKAATVEQRARELADEASAPLVSVVMPVVDELDLAERALHSVRLQSYSNWEIVVVVDKNATDNGRLTEIAKADARVHIVRGNGGAPGAARNVGIDLARGEYITFLDHDDWFMPTKIARQVSAMIEHGAIFSHTSYLVVYPSRNLGPAVIRSGELSGMLFPEIMSKCPIATPTVMIHRAIAAAGFRFSDSAQLAEDTILWTEIASNHPVLGIDVPLSVVEWSDASAAINLDKQALALKAIYGCYTNHPIFGLFPDQLQKLQSAIESVESLQQSGGPNGKPIVYPSATSELFEQSQ
jgi:hypothetical protein